MAGLSNQNLFNGINSFAEDNIAYHSIVTDNQYMAEIGLSTFTVSQLYNWMSQRNAAGEFVNLQYFAIPGLSRRLSGSETVEDRILGGKLGSIIFGTSYECGNYEDWMSFLKWEKKNRSGEYIKTQYFNWKYYNQYQFSDLQFNSFKDFDITLQKVPGPYDDNYNLFVTPSRHIDELISIFITLNDLSRYLPVLRDFYSNLSNLPKVWRAAHEFIMDIKTSQNRCLEWSTLIRFNNPLTPNFACIKEECVNFKLYLYDFTNPNNPNRSVAFNGDNFFLTLPRTDEFGRLSKNDGTGDFDLPEVDPEKASQSKAAAQLALSVNPSDGKAYSGSPTVLVRLAAELPAGQGPDFNTNDNIDQEKDTTKCIAPGTGIAIPIKEQNGNSFQWASQYAEPRCKKNTNKFTINVLNFSKNVFPSGVLGYATKLMGQSLWSFIPAGDYDQAVDRTPSNWSFTYLMMNFDNFFTSRWTYTNSSDRSPNPLGRFKVPQYEEAVHKFYYQESFSAPQILDNFPPLQVTSWDFMSDNIGGLRQGNALSNTIFGITNKNEPWPDFEGGVYSTPFFGCVFPGGYDTGGKNYFQPISQKIDVYKKEDDGITTGHFIKPIIANTIIFDNSKNDAASSRGENFDDGIFVPGPLQQTLNHLPADIATNGSKNPLINYYDIYQAFQITDLSNDYIATKENFQANISKIIGNNHKNKQIWLYQGNPNNSAFDFKPLNSYKLQFRPLKHEVYDAFQKHDIPFAPGVEVLHLLGTFARRARNYQRDNAMPISENVLQRNKWFTKSNWEDLTPPNFNISAKEGMQIDKVGGPGGKSLRYNWGLIRLGDLRDFNNGAKFPWIWRTYNPNKWLADPERGSGAIGVIGVAFTVSFQRAITFNTNYLFGMRSSFGPGNTVGGNVSSRPWYQSIGGYGNDYDSMHNTQLYARIFHHWPKEYTIYDPAKFAVFHFNTRDSSLNYNDYIYVENEQLVPEDTLIYSNSPIKTTVNSSRKEKLLPYTYIMGHTIGIPISQGSIIIDDTGSGYTANDLFIVSGGSGTSPKLKPTVDNNGGITGFQYLDSNNKGYNYRPGDFTSQNANPGSGGLQIVPDPTTPTVGTGFSGRVIHGVIVKATLTDPKPAFVGESFIQLTGNIPIRDDPNVTIMEPVTGARTQSIQVDSAKKSKDNRYDVFLHFHNDTSHTLIEAGGAAGPALENYVELEILPD